MSDRSGQNDTSRPILTVKNVNKIYQTSKGDFAAVADANLEVYEHEFICLLGPSGCGKSTLLNLIAGLIEPSSGEIIFNGKSIKGSSPDRGMVFQAYAAFPWMTVWQNIEFGPKMRKLPVQDRKKIVEKQIELVGLNGFEHLYPKELSGGMNKRVDLARAYANDPMLLCMDEPFGALDAQTRQKMQLELLRIWNVEKKTVIFVTHDMEEAVLLADRIVVMQRNPNSIRRIITINFPRPRGMEIKLERDFQELRLTLWEALEQ